MATHGSSEAELKRIGGAFHNACWIGAALQVIVRQIAKPEEQLFIGLPGDTESA